MARVRRYYLREPRRALVLVSNLIPYLGLPLPLPLPLPLRRWLFLGGLVGDAAGRISGRALAANQTRHGRNDAHEMPFQTARRAAVGPAVHLSMGIQVAHAHHDGDLVAVRQEVCSSS